MYRFQEYAQADETAKTHLYIGNTPSEVYPQLNQNLRQSMLILPPVFFHMDFLLIQVLSESGYGELNITIEKKKHEYVVYLKTHQSQRYFLSKEDSQIVHKAYEQLIDNWHHWFSEIR
ncbi:MAG: hypothetical protein AAF630_05870 [Cyanobacteria bacterium P01_C01_bin.38]